MSKQYILASPLSDKIIGPFEEFKEAEEVLNSINEIICFTQQQWNLRTIIKPTPENLTEVIKELKRYYCYKKKFP